ncbi:hypothetical protein [Aureibaculum luteum]|uniref:hypothetical protein n=1 Tax=Aureibaculum luteum TaxID=1548456 RepID=UPI000E51DDB7|nr:hypothetical protein [Aureibaculum luteum]
MLKKIKQFLPILIFATSISQAQTFNVTRIQDVYKIQVNVNGLPYLSSPSEGLWSIATTWKNDWPTDWKHAEATSFNTYGEWTVLRGKLSLPQGDWHFQDAYKQEKDKVKCIRRFEWRGNEELDSITLAIRWKVKAEKAQTFLPGILYYGNPSGEKNGVRKIPVYHGETGEKAIFEEHRYTMPFASLEWQDTNAFKGAALHSIPSPVVGANHFDQWWSLGVEAFESDSELVLLSGPITYNNRLSVAKALQTKEMAYPDTFMKVKPGTVIEKTFYLEAYDVDSKGAGFQKPLYSSIAIFNPFYVGDLPSYNDILKSKYQFTKARYMETPTYAGFNMFPENIVPQIVLGWAGQSEAPTYALQVLKERFKDDNIWGMVQKSLDHITTSTIGKEGFMVNYNTNTKKWSSTDPVSQGQAMNSIILAIKTGRKRQEINTKLWETFIKKVCDIHSKRILSNAWNPINTAEAFYISPLLIAGKLFKNETYKKAALKMTEYYGKRHLDMTEPYWGGTLDATCEDKEGAWGAFQGFLAAYEHTKEPKYLKWAKHAGDVTLSYTVVWDIPLPAGRLADHNFKTRGWTGVSPQNQHLDVYGVLIAPSIYKLGVYTQKESLKQLSKVMYRSCGQLLDPFGSQGEQIQQTNFAQHGDMSNVFKLRGGYSEGWTVYWITAHFLHAAAQFEEMGVKL